MRRMSRQVACRNATRCETYAEVGWGAVCDESRLHGSAGGQGFLRGRLLYPARRQPVALLPDRTADTVAQWLREHPGVKVIARDRSTAYAEGARQGAPAATQVADRFHLLQNLREALDQVFLTHSTVLDVVNATMRQQPLLLPAGVVAVPVPPHDIPLPAQQRTAQRQARRQALHEQVWALHRQGWTASAIAQEVGLSLRTVQRDLRSTTFAGR